MTASWQKTRTGHLASPKPDGELCGTKNRTQTRIEILDFCATNKIRCDTVLFGCIIQP